jgi:hypothetical protein
LLRLRAADGRQAVAKLYRRDGRGRLEREFGALTYLRAAGFDNVPYSHFRCDEGYYAGYSLEPGTTQKRSGLVEG